MTAPFFMPLQWEGGPLAVDEAGVSAPPSVSHSADSSPGVGAMAAQLLVPVSS